ncbi:hypothetical protein O0L34_g10406 [Tuta absoluta]|nr:hypothetical protein O0L34_g10406 [Tuta absoluta]
MILKTVILIVLLQNVVLSASLHLSEASKHEILDAIENNLNNELTKKNQDDVGILANTRRRLGSWISDNMLPGSFVGRVLPGSFAGRAASEAEEVENEVTTGSANLDRSAQKVNFDEIINYLQEGYGKYQRVVNDEETMDFLNELYNKDYQGWVDLIYSKEVQDWFTSLFGKVEGAMVEHIINTRINTNPVLSLMRSGLTYLSPVTGGDPTHAMVSKVVSGVLHG